MQNYLVNNGYQKKDMKKLLKKKRNTINERTLNVSPFDLGKNSFSTGKTGKTLFQSGIHEIDKQYDEFEGLSRAS